MCQVLYYYLVHYLFSGVFLPFQGNKTNISLLLSWLDWQVFSEKLVWKLAHSCQILPEKRNSQHSQDDDRVFHIGYQSTCRSWHPSLLPGSHVVIFWFNIFIMSSILWLYQTQGLFIICVPDTDVTENSHSNCSWKAGYTHTHTP